MPRPAPLDVYSSTAYEEVNLTPRTPHSRSGRAEEGYYSPSMSGNSHYDDYEPPTSSSQPLLDRRKDHRPPTGVLSNGPLVCWCMMAATLLCLAGISFKWPGSLQEFLGLRGHSQIHTSSLLITYENYTKFPLTSSQYTTECYIMTRGFMTMEKYWEAHGSIGIMDVEHIEEPDVCSSTITYMLDGERGLLADLALISQAAALARERNRTFLIDDTYWNRGNWIDHFQSVRLTQPGPEPNCKPPPPEEYVACPRLARHWVITSRTAKFHFGHMFDNEYEDAYSRNTQRLKPVYDHAAVSLSTTIKPSESVARLISLARAELPPTYISAHIRRGDRKPGSYAYHGQFVPLNDFADVISDSSAPAAFLASDSPAAIVDLTESIEIPTFSLPLSKHAEIRALASPQEYNQTIFANFTQSMRVLATQGMIVDFALLTGLWTDKADSVSKVVCTKSSVVCRLSAVALGWDKAFGGLDKAGLINRETMAWVDIDEKGVIIPQWTAYELF